MSTIQATRTAERVNLYADPICHQSEDSDLGTVSYRLQMQLKRILTLIDMMAPIHHFHRVDLLASLLNDLLVTDYTNRTIHRDLIVLEEMGLVDEQVVYRGMRRLRTYRLNLKRSETMQAAAIASEAASVKPSKPRSSCYTLMLFDDELGWYAASSKPRPIAEWSETISSIEGDGSLFALIPCTEADAFVKAVAREGDLDYDDDSDSLDDDDSVSFAEEDLQRGKYHQWDTMILDLDTRECWKIWQDLTFPELTARLALWQSFKTNCILIPWPAGMQGEDALLVEPKETQKSEVTDMSYWANLAAELDTPVDHEWAVLLKKTLARAKPELFDELNNSDELDAYLIVQTDGALKHFTALRNAGMPHLEAREIVMNDFLPKADAPIAEDWEIEGAAEDEAAEFGDWIG